MSFLLLFAPSLWAANASWQPVTAEERTRTKSDLEPDAAVEVLEWRVDVNDRDYPRIREEKDYARYKIYDPEKADRIMRLSAEVVTYNGYELRTAEIQARLTLPDGTVREYGRESVRERDLSKKSTPDSFWGRTFSGDEGYTIKEKFLAVGGAVPGAILEYRCVVTDRRTKLSNYHFLQVDSMPVRRMTYHQITVDRDAGFAHALYVFNCPTAELKEEKDGQVLTVTARDLHSLRSEPLSGPPVDRTATLADCYMPSTYVSFKHTGTSSRHFTRDEPWAPIATRESWAAEDHLELTAKVTATAKDLVRGADLPMEKARRIHDYVTQLYQKFVHTPPAAPTAVQRKGPLTGMDEVIKYAAVHPAWMQSEDFLWLATSLYRAAGLSAEILMLPDRTSVTFDPRVVSPAFLPGRCIALHLGEAWHFSLPVARAPLPIDELPWGYEGMGGLLALDAKQQFIDVPFASAAQSTVLRTGKFRLAENGTLTGTGTITYSGHNGYVERFGLVGKTADSQRTLMQRAITRNFDGAEIEITALRHVDVADAPMEADFTLNWPGFGVMTDGRMIFRPFVFRTTSQSPFSANERVNPVVFSFQHEQIDYLTIALPAGYEVEAKAAPPSHPGKLLTYQVGLALDKKANVLHVSREASYGLISVAAADYGKLKYWYDAVALSDAHNLVLVALPDEAAALKPAATP